MIPEAKIAEIQDAARLSEFVAAYVDLKRRGRAAVGLCPFHGEKTPSFSVNDERGFFHCFGCGAGGNVFKFLMLIENLTFPEAVRKVAARYGIDVPESDGAPSSERDALFRVSASAARYFRNCLLKTPPGRHALAYLGERGVSEQAAAAFELGASPTSGNGLLRWLQRENVDLGQAEKLGLLRRGRGGLGDRFRGRLMFPIRDPQGRTVGFGARALDGEQPKYLNSSESAIYRKRSVLYGLHELREAARSDRGRVETARLFLVEGYLDVIALFQAGIAGAVATCGTALSREQARLMKRHGGDIVTLFDGDEAGMAAAARSFPVMVEAGLWPMATFLPGGEDPDSFVRGSGVDALRRMLAEATPLAEAYVKHLGGDGRRPAEAARVGAELAGLLAKVADPFEQDFLIQKASMWTGISQEVLRRPGVSARQTTQAGPGAALGAEAAPPRTVEARRGAPGPEELLFSLMLHEAKAIATVDEAAIVEGLDEEPWATAVRAVLGRFSQGKAADIDDTLAALPGAARERVASRLIDDEMFADEGVRQKMLTDCIAGLRRRLRKREGRQAVDALRRSQTMGTAPPGGPASGSRSDVDG